MSGLSDKLKALGVKVGTEELKTTETRQPDNLDQLLDGHTFKTQLGESYVVETQYTPELLPEKVRELREFYPNAIAAWAGQPDLSTINLADVAFLDTETTGLSGGTGTMAFLVGIGAFSGDDFKLNQIFLRDPGEEAAMLAALEMSLAPYQALVTFNGKSFDIPLLNTRFLVHGWQSPLLGMGHFDLLHLARRLWRDRLSSRTLISLEVNILGAGRLEGDIPGWAIPQIYFDYLRTGDLSTMKSVLYHNAMDVFSLAALFKHMSALLAHPLQANLEHGVDLIALARLAEDLGDFDTAIQLYLLGLEYEDQQLSQVDPEFRLPRHILLDAISRLAAIHKRQENFQTAVTLWERAARQDHIQAHLELAKFYEHHQRDYSEALAWTQTAIDLLNSPGFSAIERYRLLPELETRLARLRRKINH